MKFNYITLSIFILIIILCCVVMLYQYQHKITKNEILENSVNPRIFELAKSKQVVENFEDDNNNKEDNNGLIPPDNIGNDFKDKLLITNIKIIDANQKGKAKKILVSGKNLDKIVKVFFGEIEGNMSIVSPEKIKILPPNLNDIRFRNTINFREIISLEMKFLIQDGATKDYQPVLKPLYRHPHDKETGIDISSLGLQNKDLKKGYTKQLKISFNLKYKIPIREDVQEVTQHFYTDTELDEHYPNESDRDVRQHGIEMRPMALKLYQLMTPEELKCVKSFRDMCNDETARSNPEISELCKVKGMEEIDLTQSFALAPAPEVLPDCSHIFKCPSISPGPSGETEACFPEGDRSPIQIQINGESFTVKQGYNEIFFTLNHENYDKVPIIGETLQKLKIDLDPAFKMYFEINNTDIQEDIINFYDLKIELKNQDVKVLIPSGLYYKPGLNRVSSSREGIELSANSWKLELGKKIGKNIEDDTTETPNTNMVNSITKFYSDTYGLLETEEDEPETPSMEITNWKIKSNEDTRELEFTWDTPTLFLNEPNLDRFYYYFSFEPKNLVDEDNQNEVKDNFKYGTKLAILKEQPPTQTQSTSKEFNNKITFSYDRLVPMNEYNYTFWVASTSGSGNVKAQEGVYQFITDDMRKNNFHTHLFDPETKKFKLEMINFNELKKKQPELLETYYQMVAFNKRQAEDDILTSQINMKDSNKCVKANIKQLKEGNYQSSFSKDLSKFINDENLREGPNFDANQEKQEIQIRKINKKLAELQKHHGKKVTMQDLEIKTLKSLQDGTLIRLEEIAGEKKLVKLNDGCLAYNKQLQYGSKGDYGYIPCNIFDTEQFFKINKISNLDDYNFLLSTNLRPRIEEIDDDKTQYPFYTLHPNNSEKCVSIENGMLQIRPCDDNKSIKFQGFFAKQECNL